MKIFKKNRIINTSNLSRKIRKRKEVESIKSDNFSRKTTSLIKNYGKINTKSLMKTKRKSLSSDKAPAKKYEKVYKVKHNNSKKRQSNSKSKSKGAMPKYQLSNYAEMLQNTAKIESKGSGFITKDKTSKLSNIFDLHLNNNKKNLSKKRVKL